MQCMERHGANGASGSMHTQIQRAIVGADFDAEASISGGARDKVRAQQQQQHHQAAGQCHQ